MSELVGRLAMEAGIDRSVAEETIGIAGELLRSEGLSEQIQILIDRIAGAAASSDGLTAAGTRLLRPGLGTAISKTLHMNSPASAMKPPERTRWAQ